MSFALMSAIKSGAFIVSVVLGADTAQRVGLDNKGPAVSASPRGDSTKALFPVSADEQHFLRGHADLLSAPSAYERVSGKLQQANRAYRKLSGPLQLLVMMTLLLVLLAALPIWLHMVVGMFAKPHRNSNICRFVVIAAVATVIFYLHQWLS
jgi:hypothetical protein